MRFVRFKARLFFLLFKSKRNIRNYKNVTKILYKVKKEPYFIKPSIMDDSLGCKHKLGA
jgi:hypothetical protein